MDFTLWHSAITLAAGTDGKALSDQQLTKNGVPIVVDSCIAFVTQYGEFPQIHEQRSKEKNNDYYDFQFIADSSSPPHGEEHITLSRLSLFNVFFRNVVQLFAALLLLCLKTYKRSQLIYVT